MSDDLLPLHWTVAGAVEVHGGREWSLADLGERCAEAERVGYRGLGLWHADIAHVLERRTAAEVKALLDDHGLVHVEVEFLMDWFLDPGDERRTASDARRRFLLEAAGALDARLLKVGNIPGTPCPPAQVAERFAELCTEAGQHTAATVVYEVMPFDPNVPDLATALDVVAGAPNGGLCIDTWHMSKMGIAPEELRSIPPDKLAFFELSDGRRESMDDLVDETVNQRRLPGEGELDLRGYVTAARAAGYAGPWGVEVLSAELRARPVREAFERSYAATRAAVDAGAVAPGAV